MKVFENKEKFKEKKPKDQIWICEILNNMVYKWNIRPNILGSKIDWSAILESSKDQMYNIDVKSLNHSINFTSKYELKIAGRITKCYIL